MWLGQAGTGQYEGRRSSTISVQLATQDSNNKKPVIFSTTTHQPNTILPTRLGLPQGHRAKSKCRSILTVIDEAQQQKQADNAVPSLASYDAVGTVTAAVAPTALRRMDLPNQQRHGPVA